MANLSFYFFGKLEDHIAMDITAVIKKIKIECTNDKGYLLKNKFKVALIFKLMGLANQDLWTSDNINELNKQISKILGTGNSLISCMQFFNGKKAMPFIAAYRGPNSLTSLDVDSFWKLIGPKPSIP
jgi:hypothetical protein